jgi:hypothetical protein
VPTKKKTPSAEGAKFNRNFRQKTVRVYADEALLIERLCDALSTPDIKVERSTLLVTAAVEEATLLGFTPAVPTGDPTVTSRPPEWKYDAPERKDESYKDILSVTAHPLELAAVEQAAAWANVKLQRFFMGSVLRFAAKRKAADPSNPKLKSIKIPPRFTK